MLKTFQSASREFCHKNSDPELWQSFCNGELAVNASNHIPFTRIGVDQAMDYFSKLTIGQGAISRLTTYPATLFKFCLTAPELARLADETKRLVATKTRIAPKQHCQLSQSKNYSPRMLHCPTETSHCALYHILNQRLVARTTTVKAACSNPCIRKSSLTTSNKVL